MILLSFCPYLLRSPIPSASLRDRVPVSPARFTSLTKFFRRGKCKTTASANSSVRKSRELSTPPGTRQEHREGQSAPVPRGDAALFPASPSCFASPTADTANTPRAERAQGQPSPLQAPGGTSHMQHCCSSDPGTEREVLGKHTSKSPHHPRLLLLSACSHQPK